MFPVSISATSISTFSVGFMSHVDFEKWTCHPVEFKGQGPQCDMSNQKKAMCHVTILNSHVACHLVLRRISNLRNVIVSVLGFKGHYSVNL